MFSVPESNKLYIEIFQHIEIQELRKKLTFHARENPSSMQKRCFRPNKEGKGFLLEYLPSYPTLYRGEHRQQQQQNSN